MSGLNKKEVNWIQKRARREGNISLTDDQWKEVRLEISQIVLVL